MCRVRLRKNPKLIDWVLHGRPGQVAKLACSPQANGKVTLAGSTFIVLGKGDEWHAQADSSVCSAGPAGPRQAK